MTENKPSTSFEASSFLAKSSTDEFAHCWRCFVVKRTHEPHPTKEYFNISRTEWNCRVCGERVVETEIPSFVLGLSEDEYKSLSEHVVEYPPKPNKACSSLHTCSKTCSQACKKCTATYEHSEGEASLEQACKAWCTYKGLSGCKNCLKKRKSVRYSNI